MHVRAAMPGDSLAIETIRVRGWRTAYAHVFPREELDAMTIDDSRWRQRLEDPPRGWAVFVAEEEGRVIGFACVGPSRDLRDFGELYAIYVDPDAWSTGAGRELILAAENELAGRYAEAALWVLERNTRARRFYERAGWSVDGTRKVEEFWGVDAAEVRYRKRF